MPPFPIPAVSADDEPSIKVKINKEWVTFVIGALEDLLTRPEWGQSDRTGIYASNPTPVWDGDETAQFNADQEVQRILLALAVGNLMLEDLITPGALGTVIQSDGAEWIVTMPEFNNLVARTLAANLVPLTLRSVIGQSANMLEMYGPSGSRTARLQTGGSSARLNLGLPTDASTKFLSIGSASDTLTIGNSDCGIDILNSSSGAGRLINLNFSAASLTTANRFATISSIVTGQGAGTIGAILFATKSAVADTSLTERVRIDSSGNVGIGTTSPSAKLDVNSDIIRIRTAKTPASATAAGNAGDIAWDANYLYTCVATNTWKRTALSTW